MTALKSFIAKYSLFSVCFLSLSFVSAFSYGQPEKLIAVYTEWFPYTYQSGESAAGFEIEICRSVLEKMGKEAEYRSLPWQRCLYMLKEGKADLLVSLLKTPAREEYTYFPENHISISKVLFFSRRDSSIRFTGSYEELKGHVIGVISGFSYGNIFDRTDFLKKDESLNTEMLIAKLLKGRYDIAAENLAVSIATARRMGVADQLRFLEPPLITDKLYVGFSRKKGHRKLGRDFSGILGQFKTSESYKKILGKYGVSYWDMTE
ncbi:MAG: transporter substrate-binding domain-containing protein [Desulfococcaceae bacterium]|jgi:polar amino acid transport system substrate-binding protein|nr:transporter substrate-binding domain-containing protein [Desulfococcaceae bacterium]